MPDPLQPRPTTGRAGQPADHTAARADDSSVPAPTGAAEPRFAAPAHAGEVGTFGRYRVLQKLGQGGMGAVYLGFDGTLDRKVALKVMLPQFAADRDARERFLREARAAATITSDHVVTIHDSGEERGVPFIAMAYLLGSPLDQFLKTRGDLPLHQALRVARETALGLSAAHARGLVHRDIKPGNVWLEAPKGRVKILDFGLARPADDDVHLTHSGAILGTPAYMSPEQGRGLKVDHRSDLFSLGVMLYRLTTGRMPFVGDTTMAVLTSLAVDAPIPPRRLNPELPAALEPLIGRLLAKNPAERFQTALEVVAALGEIETPGAGGPLPLPVVGPPADPSMRVGVQTQNVWEGIVDSGSVAVPVVPPDATEAEPEPPFLEPARAGAKGPLILAGVAVFAVVAALAAVLSRDAPPGKEPAAEHARPSENGPAPGELRLPPPAIKDGEDRKAAEYVLSIGGTVRVNGGETNIKAATDLPKGYYTLTAVALVSSAKVTDAGLSVFSGCKHITSVNLNNNFHITDDGVQHFADCKDLTELQLWGVRATDKALVKFKDCKRLVSLNLGFTRVTDAGLAHFKGCAGITHVWLYGTPVTDAGLTHLEHCEGLSYLCLCHTRVGNEGLARLNRCARLTQLYLESTQVTDDGLADFKDREKLQVLVVTKTKVSRGFVEEFARDRPGCKITFDGGTVEPKK